MNRLGALALVAVVLAALVLPQFLKGYGIYLISMWAVLSIAALGLNLTLGYAGQVSLAQGAFVGIGAYTVSLLLQAGWPYPIAFVCAAFLCFAVGWGLGYPALRVQHHYLAFVTLAFNTLVFLVLRNEEYMILKWFAEFEQEQGLPGLDLPGLDVAAVARGYGVPSREAQGADELIDALSEAIAVQDGPRLVQVPCASGMWLE